MTHFYEAELRIVKKALSVLKSPIYFTDEMYDWIVDNTDALPDTTVYHLKQLVKAIEEYNASTDA